MFLVQGAGVPVALDDVIEWNRGEGGGPRRVIVGVGRGANDLGVEVVGVAVVGVDGRHECFLSAGWDPRDVVVARVRWREPGILTNRELSATKSQ